MRIEIRRLIRYSGRGWRYDVHHLRTRYRYVEHDSH